MERRRAATRPQRYLRAEQYRRGGVAHLVLVLTLFRSVGARRGGGGGLIHGYGHGRQTDGKEALGAIDGTRLLVRRIPVAAFGVFCGVFMRSRVLQFIFEGWLHAN